MTRGDPMRAGSPFGVIVQAIRAAASILDGEPMTVKQHKLRARVTRHLGDNDAARVTEFFGELVGAPFGEEASVQLRAARQDPLLMGDQMLRAWEDFLAAECSALPVVLVLEDLHWGDLSSVKFVDSALRNLQDLPFMVLALARPDVEEKFPRLWAGRAVTQLHLGELSRKASDKLLRHALGAGVAPELAARVLERAAGNAFYLEELIRAVAEGKSDALPGTVMAMVQARLEALASEARRVLRAASVFGEVFWRRGVSALLGGATDDVAPWLEVLVDRELVTRQGDAKFPGEAEFAFRHALVRETAYAMLTDVDRITGHRLAAEWLEAAGESEPMVLAEHLERGGESLRAAPWYQRAAEQALEGNDFEAALQRAARGVACGVTGEIRAALLWIQAQAHGWRGELVKDEACALEAMTHAPRGGAIWCEASGVAAVASGRLGNVAKLGELADDLLDVCRSSPIAAPHVVAAARMVQRLLLAGRYDAATTLLGAVEASAIELAERDPAIAARWHQVNAWRATFAGDVGAYVSFTEAAAGAFEQIGNQRSLCETRSNLGNALSEIGRYADAERTLREASAAASRLGLRSIAALAAHNLGFALARLGKLDEAQLVERSAIEAYVAAGNRRMEGGCRIYLAMIAELAGQLDVAETEARAAIEALSGAPPVRCYALGALAHVLLARGCASEALEVARQATALLGELSQIDAGESLVRLVHAEAHYAAGDAATARASIRTAKTRLLERSANIRDTASCRSFLEDVPENARTIALARDW
jgi:tetratricopeptide (TPR) repeat protein